MALKYIKFVQKYVLMNRAKATRKCWSVSNTLNIAKLSSQAIFNS